MWEQILQMLMNMPQGQPGAMPGAPAGGGAMPGMPNLAALSTAIRPPAPAQMAPRPVTPPVAAPGPFQSLGRPRSVQGGNPLQNSIFGDLFSFDSIMQSGNPATRLGSMMRPGGSAADFQGGY